MQSLQYATIKKDASQRCAGELLACVPAVMRCIRQEMRSHRRSQLSIPQFRALIFASVRERPSLSDLAEHLGLSLPAASRMVDLLVRRGLLQRLDGVRDRRLISLVATRKGKSEFRRARSATQSALARRLNEISTDDRLQVIRSLKILEGIFGVSLLQQGLTNQSTSRRQSTGGLK